MKNISSDEIPNTNANPCKDYLKKLKFAVFVALFGVLFGVQDAKSQTVSSYTFAQTAGTYTAITGGTTAIAAATDDGVGSLINIGFTFTYHGTAFTQFAAGSNGYIQLGAATSTTIPSGYANMIMYMGGDGKTGTTAPTYLLSGTSPNRVLTVQFPVQWVYYSVATDAITAQIKLYETTNVIQIVYGASAHVYAYARSVGIVGATTSDYSTRVSTFAASTAGSSAAATMPWSATVFPASGLTYTWTPPLSTPCSGTPTAGTAATSATAISCSGTTNLSLTGSSTGSGLAYQWQQSFNAGAYANITGATTAAYTTGTLSAVGTYAFKCNVTCTASGLSALSAASATLTLTNTLCTCTAYPSSSATSAADDEILNVTVGTLNNTSTCASLAGGAGSVVAMYSKYSGIVAAPSLTAGNTVSGSVTIGFCSGYAYATGFAVYIDYNQNGVFTDAGEMVYSPNATFTPAVAGTAYPFTFTVPVGATVGTTRMRIVDIEGVALPVSTGTYTWGETED